MPTDLNIPKKHPWSVTLDFGEHANKTYGEVVLTQPGYVRWMLANIEAQPHDHGQLQFLKQTIEAFDRLPFQDGCQRISNGVPCDNATSMPFRTTRETRCPSGAKNVILVPVTNRAPR